MVETSDEWILTRTGISERHIAGPDVATSDMAANAATAALLEAGIPASELDAIIVCTVTPDMFFPATACLVQDKIGATNAWGFDLSAACAGFIYGITTAAGLVMAGTQKKCSSLAPTQCPASLITRTAQLVCCLATGRVRF